MKVIVLAAGRSKRLKPIEDKNFLEFLGKPLIQLQLEQMARAGLRDLVVVGGAHNLAKLRDLAGVMKPSIEFQVVEQKNLDEGMAGAVLSVERLVKNDAMMIVSANDVVDEEAYRSMLKECADKKFDSFLLGKKVSEYFPGGYLKVRGGSGANARQITGIIEKPGKGKEPSKMVNLVVHYYKNAAMMFKAVKSVKSSRDDRYEVALDSLMKAGVKMKVVPFDGMWQPVKYPWHVLDLMDYFFKKMVAYAISKPPKNHVGKPEVARSAKLHGDVFLAPGVRVMDNAVIIGPAYIGKNTIVATNALVRGSNIGANCVIGFGTEVARSHLGNDVWTHTNYVGDSVIGDNVSFGAGTITGNLRLDEGTITVGATSAGGDKVDSGRTKFGLVTGCDVRCGINTSFMPGVKIGNNVCVGAGITVAQDVPDDTFVYGRTELIMKPNRLRINALKRLNIRTKKGKAG